MGTEAATQAQDTGTQAQAAQAPAAVTSPAQVEKSLAEMVHDHAEMVQRMARGGRIEAPQTTTETEKPAAVAEQLQATAETTTGTVPTADKPAKITTDVPKSADAKTPEDSRAKQLADFVRAQRAARAEAERLKAERESLAAERAALAKEKESTTATKADLDKFNSEFAKDPVRAVRHRLGNEKFRTDFLLAALDAAGETDDGEPVVSDAEKEKLREEAIVAKAKAAAKAELEAETKAAEEKRKAERQQTNLAAQEQYFGKLDSVLRATPEKWPNMAEDGWATSEMVAAIEEHHRATGTWPTHEMVLNHFEGKHVAKAEAYARRMGKGKTSETSTTSTAKPSPASAPVKSPLDARGLPSKTVKRGTPDQQKEEIMARLNGMKVS